MNGSFKNQTTQEEPLCQAQPTVSLPPVSINETKTEMELKKFQEKKPLRQNWKA